LNELKLVKKVRFGMRANINGPVFSRGKNRREGNTGGKGRGTKEKRVFVFSIVRG